MTDLGFFNGTPAYNAVNLGVGVVGLSITLGSLAAARRAARAAEAAESAARKAQRLIRGIGLTAELAEARGYLHEALAQLESGAAEVTLAYLLVVRERVARASRLTEAERAAARPEWAALVADLGEMYGDIRQLQAVDPPPSRLELQPQVEKLLSVTGRLAIIQTVAEQDAAGG